MGHSGSGACVGCHNPLGFLAEADDYDEEMGGTSNPGKGSYIDDDVHLRCVCHFHWSVTMCGIIFMLTDDIVYRECLLEGYIVGDCPNCGKNLITRLESGEEQLLCDLKNEGGLQQELDILLLMNEEVHLKTFPEERKCQAFLDLCGEGDVRAIIELLRDSDEDESLLVDVLRYQDPIATGNSALHVAIQNDQEDVVWHFPPQVWNAINTASITKEDQMGKPDIRGLKDAGGKTAEQRATETGSRWINLLNSGVLSPPG